MKIAYLDCFAGLSGDMFLAAWLDSSLISSQLLTERLALLRLSKVHLKIRSVTRRSIQATKLDFESTAREKVHHRSFRDIRKLIRASELASEERKRALAIFQLLTKAEGHVHGVPAEDVHFHEIGALDSILDIVGAAIVIEALKIKRWYASKVNLGSGTVATQHGIFPVPAPATVELLKGMPAYSSGIEAELVTPTGAAILRHLEPEFRMPPARWDAVGYGAGTRELEIPNTLRVLIGQSLLERPIETREVFLIETDIDDMNPQFLPYVQELLLKQGAQDVSWHALQMKKGRTGFRLCVLTAAEQVEALSELIFRETTTLGLRMHVVEKRMLDREIITVTIPQGKVRVKLGRLGKAIFNVMPEYEDCRALADATGLPLKEIENLARAAAERRLKQKRR